MFKKSFIPKDKKRIFLFGIIFCIWLIAVFTFFGSFKKPTSNQNKITQTVAIDEIPEEQRTPEQKAAIQKMTELSVKSVNSDMGNLANILKLNNSWTAQAPLIQKNMPILFLYFPQGQSIEAWREALVFRSFYNIKVKSPEPLVMEVYEIWLKEQAPDIQLKKSTTKDGIFFKGYSSKLKVYLCGKIIIGSLDNIVYILQYCIKNDGNNKYFEEATSKWTSIMENLN